MLSLVYIHSDNIQLYVEKGGVFELRQTVETEGVEDTVLKINQVVRTCLENSVKAVVFRGNISNAMFIRDRRCCVNLKLRAMRCFVGICLFYAKECIKLASTGSLLQTLDGKTRYRRKAGSLMHLGKGDISYDEVRSSLNRELEEGGNDTRREIINEVVSVGGSLELLRRLDKALEEVRRENPTVTLVLDTERYPGGFTSEVCRRIGRSDMPPVYEIIED